MLGIGKCAQSWFYTEYSICTPTSILWIKGCQLFRNCRCNVTHYKSFGVGLTAINEVRNSIDYILEDIFILLPLVVLCSGVWCLASISRIIYIFRIISISRKIPYTGFLHVLIPGLPYPGKFPYRVIFSYPVNASILKTDR